MSEIKHGMIKYYHRGLLTKKWKEYKFQLFENSILQWYTDVKHKKPDGCIRLKDVSRFIAIGPYTKCLPDYPHLDDICDEIALMAFPKTIETRDREIIWLLFHDINHLNEWMKAIVKTLPPRKTLEINKPSPLLTSPSPVSENSSPKSVQQEQQTLPSPLGSPSLLSSDMALPLAAGLFSTFSQGHTMNSQHKQQQPLSPNTAGNTTISTNPLSTIGYDLDESMYGLGDAWGHLPYCGLPGFAGLGGGGCYSNHIDLLRTDEDAIKLKEIEDGNSDGHENHEQMIEHANTELMMGGKYGSDHENDDRESDNEKSEENYGEGLADPTKGIMEEEDLRQMENEMEQVEDPVHSLG